MKALIISNEEDFINSLDDFFKKHGADTIIYKWLLKALDNIEEIHPDVIVLNSSEYPRHWKTLVQFVKSGIGGDNVSIFLYEPAPLSEDDEEKIKLLGISGVFKKLEEESFECISDVIFKDSEIAQASEPQAVEFKITPKEKKEDTSPSLVFTNPFTKAFVTGKILSFKDEDVEFTTDFKEQIYGLESGINLEYVTVYSDDDCSTLSAQVLSVEKDKNTLCFKLNYEKKL